MGKCPDCGTWDALEAQRVEVKARVDPRAHALASWTDQALAGLPGSPIGESSPRPDAPASIARPIAEVGSSQQLVRTATGIGELDRVLGGGFVPGSAVLVGGDPGIGKSTLLLQAAGALAKRGTRTLYVSSEESAEQVKLRAARLGVAETPDLLLLAETSLGRITEQAARALGERDPAAPAPVMVIDSIQMIYKADMEAFPGSLTQLRRCCAELCYMAKAAGVTTVLVGHVTKEGELAGPRMLEHLVDAVLYFEGDRYHAHRVVRAVKNRFGTTLEIGLFEMTGEGLTEAAAGASFAAVTGGPGPRPGTVVCPVMTGSRCLLVEIQALTATGFPGATKRKSSGLDANRLAMLIAVLEQHAGMRLADRDIFASAVGGVRVAEPASDLALLLAIAGAQARRSLPATAVAVGEVGLGGEVRPAPQMEQRLREAARLGFGLVIGPRAGSGPGKNTTKGVEYIPVRTIAEAIDHLANIPGARAPQS
jgi:DNA repair protein RadA/Sms